MDNTVLLDENPTNPELMVLSDRIAFAGPIIDSPMNSFTLDSEMDLWNDITGDGSSFWDYNMNQATGLFAPFPDEPVCSCFSQAVGLFESAEVHLVWNIDEHSATGMELLQQQKATITDCQSMLDCDRCTDQSSFAILLISICGKVVSSLEKVSCELQSTSTPTGSHTKGQHGDHDFLQLDLASATRRQLDGDDRLVVLASLFRSRVGKMHSLIAELEAMVTKKHWQIQMKMIRDLKCRVQLIDA